MYLLPENLIKLLISINTDINLDIFEKYIIHIDILILF